MSEVVEQPTPEATVSPQGPVVPAASDQPAQNPSAPEAGAKQEDKPPQDSTDEQPEKRGKNRFERRLDRAYRREAEAKARADLLERQIEELRTRVEGPKDQIQPGEPRLSDFDDIEKYAAAKAEWREKKAIEKYEATQREKAQKDQVAKLAEDWREKAEKASEKYDDWDDVVGEMTPNSPLSVAVMHAENAADVAYHLGKNMGEAKRIASLPPVAQFLAIGVLSARLQADPPKPKQPSKAPPPIVPLSGKDAVQSDAHQPDDDMRTFIRKRNRELGRQVAKR